MKSSGKLALLASLYFSQGLPFGFFTQSLPVLMRQRGLSLEEIGLASLLALPWALKFLWAPWVDRHGGSRLGARRGYILPLQLAATALCLGLAFYTPPPARPGLGARGLLPMLVAVLLVNLIAATQDIATDAMAVDLLDEKERGLGNGVQVAGYRVGMIVGGGALLILMARLGWRGMFLVMAGLLGLATLPIALHREAPRPSLSPREAPRWGTALASWLARPGALPWLGLLVVYKAGEALATGMLRTFLVDRNLGLEEIGVLLGTVAFTAGLVGAMLGGWLVNRFGRRGALVGFGVLQAFAVAGYAIAAAFPVGKLVLYAICGGEHLASGMATAALFTVMMDACRAEAAATDYTVQASVVVAATGGAAALSGFSAARLGYAGHFALASGACLVAVVYAALHRSPTSALSLDRTAA